MEPLEFVVFSIQINAAWRVPLDKQTYDSRIPGGYSRKPRRGTACFKEWTLHNEVSNSFAQEILSPNDFQMVSATTDDAKPERVGVSLTKGNTGISVTTQLRIKNGLQYDVVMKREIAEALHSHMNAVPLASRANLGNRFNSPDEEAHPVESKEMIMMTPSALRDYQQFNMSSFLEAHIPIKPHSRYANEQQTPTANYPEPYGTIPRRRFSINHDASDCSSEMCRSDLSYCCNGLSACRPESPTSNSTVSIQQLEDDGVPRSCEIINSNEICHQDPTIKESSSQVNGTPKPVSEAYQHHHEPKRHNASPPNDQAGSQRHDKKLGSASTMQNADLIDIKMHPGHKHWEWDQQAQRWHKIGGSHDDEMDWFPDVFSS